MPLRLTCPTPSALESVAIDASRAFLSATGSDWRWPNSILAIGRGEIFALLGPNGGGKTTLFRAALDARSRCRPATVAILGLDLARERHAIRPRIGVVFQAPSLDRKLTVAENLRHQGHLYGLAGESLATAPDEMLDAVGPDRAGRTNWPKSSRAVCGGASSWPRG